MSEEGMLLESDMRELVSRYEEFKKAYTTAKKKIEDRIAPYIEALENMKKELGELEETILDALPSGGRFAGASHVYTSKKSLSTVLYDKSSFLRWCLQTDSLDMVSDRLHIPNVLKAYSGAEIPGVTIKEIFVLSIRKGE